MNTTLHKNSDKVIDALKRQGRKKVWLSEQLNISRVYLDKRLKDNSFKDEEIKKLKELGIL